MKKLIKQHQKELIFNYLTSNYLHLNNNKEDQKNQWFKGVLKNFFYKKYNHLLSDITIDTKNLNFLNTNIDIINFDFKLRHILDYLTSQDAPKNFFSMTFEEAEKQTLIWDNWLKERAKKGDDPLNVLLRFELKDNWKVFELKSKQALLYEGGVMQHCVASYIDKVISGQTSIFSIRDNNLNSHITIEYDHQKKEIVQIQGKQNNKPIEKYIPYLINFLEKSNFELTPRIYQNYNFLKFNKTIYYNKTKEEIDNIIFDFFEKNIDKEVNGGSLILSNITKPIDIYGNWEKILIHNVENINVNNITCKTITIDNSKVNKFENIQSLDLNINNSNFINFNNVLSLMLNSNFSNFSNLDLSFSKFINIKNHLSSLKISNSQNNNLESFNLSNCYVYGLNNVNSSTVNLSGVKSIDNKNIILDNVVHLSLDTYDFEHLNKETLPKNIKSIDIKIGKKILSITDLDNPDLNISIGSCPNLNTINLININNLNISNIDNLNTLTKNKINRLTIFFGENQKNKNIENISRNRIKQIKTNNVHVFKPKKIYNKPR